MGQTEFAQNIQPASKLLLKQSLLICCAIIYHTVRALKPLTVFFINVLWQSNSKILELDKLRVMMDVLQYLCTIFNDTLTSIDITV